MTHHARLMCSASLVAILGVGLAGSLMSQPSGEFSERPRLPPGADTNSARSYYGPVTLGGNPRSLYWAVRLDPANAEYRLAYAVAFLFSQPMSFLEKFGEGDAKALTSPTAKKIQELFEAAFLRNPFVMLPNAGWCDERVSSIKDPMKAGRIDFRNGCYKRAVVELGEGLRKNPGKVERRVERAHAFYALKQYDSAAVELQTVLDTLQGRDQKQLVYTYESRSMFAYAMGIAYMLSDDLPDARKAFERALSDDLSFYMAHARLAAVAKKQGDGMAALAAFALAVELRPDDGVLRYDYASTLMEERHDDEAVAQFLKAIELEPHFANPYFNLAIVLERQGKAAEAAAQYANFIARAPRVMAKQIELARQRIRIGNRE